jgi:hypothetical protein
MTLTTPVEIELLAKSGPKNLATNGLAVGSFCLGPNSSTRHMNYTQFDPLAREERCSHLMHSGRR